MRLSEQTEKLLPALLAIQKEVEVKKTEENPFHKSRYADLETIYRAILPEMEKHGLVAVQTVDDDGCLPGQVLVITRIFHIESGQWVESRFRMDAKAATPQDLGSAVTYSRRYSLVTALGLTPVDDDAERAQSGYRQPNPGQEPRPRGYNGAAKYQKTSGIDVTKDPVNTIASARNAILALKAAHSLEWETITEVTAIPSVLKCEDIQLLKAGLKNLEGYVQNYYGKAV